MAIKLTKESIDGLRPAKRVEWVADSVLRGFYVVVYETGAKIFFVRFRTVGGARQLIRIGRFGEFTVDGARKKAKELLAAASLGADLAADRAHARAMPTYREWITTYLARVRLEKKSPHEDHRFLPMAASKWGARPLDAITREEILRFRQTLERTPAQANRWLASVRACLSAAVRSGVLTTNPALGIRPFKENPPRSRVLNADEMERLLIAIEADDDIYAKAALKILILTGARGNELVRAKWTDIDLDSGIWRLPSPKAGHVQVIPIDAHVTAVLKSLPRVEGNPFIIPGHLKGKPRHGFRGIWERSKERAGLQDAGITIHDIRRTFGLHIAKSAGLHVASKLLRHSSVKITESVYAPLGIDELRAALAKRADVLPFPERKKETG